MELISIIPDFQPRNDPELLKKAEALRPELHHTEYPAPAAYLLNGAPLAGNPEETELRQGDQLLADFGRHLVGRVSLQLAAAGSHQDAPAFLQLDLAEIPGELAEDPESYHGWLSPSWIQRERLHIDRLPAEATLPRRYAFRYVRLTVLGTSPKYRLVVKGISCRAESAADETRLPALSPLDPELTAIRAAGLRTLAECMQEVLEDGPKRDQRLWLGDLRLQALGIYASYRQTDLVKRCLYLFAGTTFPDGRMSANVFTEPEPAADDTYLADFALIYPMALQEYLSETDDGEAAEDLTEPALAQTDWVLAHCLGADGLITREAAKDCLIDWSDTLDRSACLTGVLICSLDACAGLCTRRGAELRAAAYRRVAAQLRRSALEKWWSEQEGCFVTGGQTAIHTQVWMTLADVMPEGRAEAAFEKALNAPDSPRMMTPYMHHYYVTALLRAGLREKAEAHLRSYWGGMIAQGGDTFWECWDPEHPEASPYGGRVVNSHCHAWSCTPVYLIGRFFS